MTRHLIALAIALVPSAVVAQNLEIEGMSIGQTHAGFMKAHVGIRCPAPEPEEIRECFYRRADGNVTALASVSGQPANTWLFNFVGGRLAHVLVTFPRASLDAVNSDVGRKFGKPNQVANVGASRVLLWGDGNATLGLRESFDPDTSALVLMSNTFDYRAAMRDAKKHDPKPRGQ